MMLYLLINSLVRKAFLSIVGSNFALVLETDDGAAVCRMLV